MTVTKPRLKEKYDSELLKQLMEERKFSNVMEAPRLKKITINMGVGSATQNAKELEGAVKDLAKISGQKPVITKAKKSIASFKVREGNSIGCKVTLRGARMYEFLDRLLNVAIPRIKDFRGISRKSFDGRGNYTLGIKEQLVFPEVEYDQVIKVRGLDIVIVTTANTNEEALALLTEFGLPFRK